MTLMVRILCNCFILNSLISLTVAVLQGQELNCTNEGGLVEVPIIKDPCIRCFCKDSVIKCERDFCPSVDGCHLILFGQKQNGTCCDVCAGCSEDGVKYNDGDVWSLKEDACVTKQCKAGVITTSRTICPKPACSNPVKVKGECCPSCPTCEANGKVYKEGDIYQPNTDPCVTCECKDSKSKCIRKACPVLNCPPSKIKHKDGECCPKCVGQRSLFLVPRMCLFQQKMYRHGTSHRVNECISCTCDAGTMSCTKEVCPVLNCSASDEIYLKDGACCPVCKPSVTVKSCIHEGVEHEHGNTWVFSCADCSCNNGTVTCKKSACEVEQHCPLDTHQLKFIPGQCCPECVERDGLCTVFGDPHYITYDRKIYDFQGTCKYLLTKDCANKKFAIFVRNFDRYNMPGAWTKSVTILLRGIKIGLRKNGKVTINKSRVSLPFSQAGRFVVKYEDLSIVLEADIGLKVVWNTESYLEVHVSSSFKGKTCGMCGNFNGDSVDDFMGRDKVIHQDAISFAQSWQRGRKNRCEVGITQYEVQTRCRDNFSKWARAHQECTILKSRALRGCRKKVSVDDYYRSCITDACNCPRRRKCTCDAVTAYVRECERLGIYNTKAPLNYSCSRQRRRIQQRVNRNLRRT